jgi:predicted  nucleic acid-binding Zn-ribbon protein
MNIDPFPFFLNLINFDQETLALNEQRNDYLEEIALSQKHITNLNNDLNQYKHAVNVAQKEVDAQELRMKELDDKEQRTKNYLEQSATIKEHAGLKKEIAHLKEEQHTNEAFLIASWQTLETANKDYSDRTQKILTEIRLLEDGITHTHEIIAKLDQEIAARGPLREEKIQNVPAELLEKYVAMRTRISDPVVPIKSESCSACWHHLTRQEIANTKFKRLIQCTDCFRFLYLPDDPMNNRISERAINEHAQ